MGLSGPLVIFFQDMIMTFILYTLWIGALSLVNAMVWNLNPQLQPQTGHLFSKTLSHFKSGIQAMQKLILDLNFGCASIGIGLR